MFWQLNQEILKTSKNNHKKLFNYCAHSLRGFTEEIVLLKVLCLKWSVKKRCVAKVFFMTVILTIFPKNLATCLLSSPF